MQDMKAALGNASKPDITHVRTQFMVYIARACEYGSAKYERANYMRQCGDGSTKANFYRFSQYLRSAYSHIGKTLDSMELYLANDPYLEDEEGMLAAMYAPDTDVTPGATVGASMLPHVAHGAAGLMMAVVQAVLYKALPEDPGQPWTIEPELEKVEPEWTGEGFERLIPNVILREGDIHILNGRPQPLEDHAWNRPLNDVAEVWRKLSEPEPEAEVNTGAVLAGVYRCAHGTKEGMYCEECHARVAKSDD